MTCSIKMEISPVGIIAATLLIAANLVLTGCIGSGAGTSAADAAASKVLNGITIDPYPKVAKGKTLIMTATGTYADGHSEDISKLVTWSSSNANYASFGSAASSVVSGISYGNPTIQATLAGRTSNPGILNVTSDFTGSLITARQFHTATLLANGKVLVVGGITTSPVQGAVPVLLSSAEIYDPATGAWTAAGGLSAARQMHTATLLPGGKVLVAGGTSSSNPMGGVILASAELYDPASGIWTATGNLTTARVSHTATLLANGKVLVTGSTMSVPAGMPSATAMPGLIASTELYDPATGTWAAIGNLNTARTGHTVTLLTNGKALVIGGSSSSGPMSSPLSISPLSTAEIYDPVTETWSSAGNLVSAHAGHAATLLANGKVLVVGGDPVVIGTSGNFTAELYDPASSSSLVTGKPSSAILAGMSSSPQLSAMLPSGKVFTVTPYGNTEEYDPSTGTWSAASSLAAINGISGGQRNIFTATLLSSGQILLAGGIYPQSVSSIASAELY